MDGILSTLKNLSLAQLVLAWLFVACYALAIGGMLGARGSLRAGGVAALAAALFAALSDVWVHGALLVLFGIAGMGLFVASSWLLAGASTWLLRHRTQATPAPAQQQPAAAATPAPAIGVWRALRRLRIAFE